MGAFGNHVLGWPGGNPAEPDPFATGVAGDNRRFVPGMEVLARPYRGAAWWFEGNPESPEHRRRLPRAVGRW